MKATTLFLAAFAGVVSGQALCDQYAYYQANGYEFNNNLWGMDSATSGSQCTYVDGTSGSGVQWHSDWTWQGAENNVKSYVYSGRQISPRFVSDLSNLQTSAQWQYNTQNIRCNVAYDLFTAADPNHSHSSGDYELMIWLARYDVYPIGSSEGQVSVGGSNWELWSGMNGDMQVYSFIAPGTTNSFNANVKDFFDYLVSNKGYPASSQYLITYQFGTEAFTGGPATFTVNQWSAEAN